MRNTTSMLLLAVLLAAGCGAPGENSASGPETSESKSVPAATIMPPKDPATAQAAPAPAPLDPRLERLEALKKEQSEAQSAYFAAFRAALGDNENPNMEQLQKVQEQVKEPDWAGFLARGQKLLDEDATDLAAFRTIQWMLDNSRESSARPALLALLEKHHMDRPEIGPLCSRLTQDGSALLEKLAASSPHRDVRGLACFALAESVKNDIEYAEYVKSGKPEEQEGIKGWLGAEKYDALAKLDAEKAGQDLERAYERVMKDYADVVVNPGTKRETTLGKQAGAALYEMKNLVVGKPAPEIEGVDLDSVSFKLSDYRGKVVLLDFWGNW